MPKTDWIVGKGVQKSGPPSLAVLSATSLSCRAFGLFLGVSQLQLNCYLRWQKKIKLKTEQYSWAGGNAVKAAASAIKILLHFRSCCTGGFDAFLSRC